MTTTVRDQDLFVVYRPEKGSPTAFSNLIVTDLNGFDFTSGENYNVYTSPANVLQDGTPRVSEGRDLSLHIHISGGVIQDVKVASGGSGYYADEVIDVDGGSGKVVVTLVDDNGAVLEASIHDGGAGYEVEDGYLDRREAFGGSGDELFVLPVVTGGELVTLSTKVTEFQPTTSFASTTPYEVGEEIRLEDNNNQPIATAIIAYVQETGAAAEPGGPFRYEGNQFKADIQALIDDTENRLVVVNDYDETKDFNGEIDFDKATDTLTYYRGGAVPYSVDNFGYNFDGDTNQWSADLVSTQAEFNDTIFKRVRFIEDNIYSPIFPSDTGINNEFPRPEISQIKTYGDYVGVPDDDHAVIPSFTDLDQIRETADGNTVLIEEIQNTLVNLEAGGLVFKGKVSSGSPLPAIADTQVGHFYVAEETYTDAEIGDLTVEDFIAVGEEDSNPSVSSMLSFRKHPIRYLPTSRRW